MRKSCCSTVATKSRIPLNKQIPAYKAPDDEIPIPEIIAKIAPSEKSGIQISA